MSSVNLALSLAMPFSGGTPTEPTEEYVFHEILFGFSLLPSSLA